MSFLNRLRKLIKTTDFFYSTEMLRYNDDNQYKTLTGGIVSIGIIITIIIGFANLILDTLSLNSFTISTQTIKNPVPTNSAVAVRQDNQFRFALQVWRQNITTGKRYFDITMRYENRVYTELVNLTYYALEPCKRDYFKGYPELYKNFDRLWADTWLCPPYNFTFDLEGKYTSKDYHQYIIEVNYCKNQTYPDRPCATPEEIQAYFTENANYFYFTFYFTNVQINPDKKDYKQYYLQDMAYGLFGSHIGTETFLYFTDYTVQTDYSIWPFSNIQTDKGIYASDLGINHPFQTSLKGKYITWNIAKGTNSIVYTRQVQKLSIVFSFMGGMVGAISAALFIIKLYNNVSFQFSIAFSIFKPKLQDPKSAQLENFKEGEPGQFNEKDQNKGDTPPPPPKRLENISMNFFMFIKFYIYRFLDYFDFKYLKYESPELKYAQQCKEEILKQLNIKKLLKRIIFIEHCLTKILDDYHLDILQLKKPQTPYEIKQCRLKCQSILDNQLYNSQSSDNSDYVEVKKQRTINQNFIETPNTIINIDEASFMSRNKLKVTTKRLKTEQLGCDMKNEMFIIDVQQIKNESNERNEPSPSGISTNEMRNQLSIRKKLKMQQSHLMKLMATAEEGNEISSMIWRNLDKQKKTRKEKKQFTMSNDGGS